MQSRMAMTYALALALSAGIYAASVQMTKSGDRMEDMAGVASGVPLSWAPDWLVKPLSRAIADATDPRERSKETGAPID